METLHSVGNYRILCDCSRYHILLYSISRGSVKTRVVWNGKNFTAVDLWRSIGVSVSAGSQFFRTGVPVLAEERPGNYNNKEEKMSAPYMCTAQFMSGAAAYLWLAGDADTAASYQYSESCKRFSGLFREYPCVEFQVFKKQPRDGSICQSVSGSIFR